MKAASTTNPFRTKSYNDEPWMVSEKCFTGYRVSCEVAGIRLASTDEYCPICRSKDYKERHGNSNYQVNNDLKKQHDLTFSL